MAAEPMAELLAIDLPPDRKYETAAGFTLSLLGHLPEVGEAVDAFGWRFEIVDLDGRRIDKLLVKRIGRRRAARHG
jgi:putative hemolysin